MRITVPEVIKLVNAIQEVSDRAKRLERERANGIIQDEQHKMNVRVKQCAEALTKEASQAQDLACINAMKKAATVVRDMLDDRPPPESDPDGAQRFPSMFKGGPV